MFTSAFTRTDASRRPSTGGLAGIAFALATAGSVVAADLRVPADFATPQAAITAASDGDVVIVSPGVWPPINTQGRAITVRSEDPSDPAIVAATILDGDGDGPVLTFIQGERLDTVIEGFTITGGSSSFGGGIAILGADPLIRDCVIIGNEATVQGGGIYVSLSAAKFERCRIEGNIAPRGGGAATFLTDWVRFKNCTFIENVASTDGGGLYNGADFVRIDECEFIGNEAGAIGGGFMFDDSSGFVANSIFRGNVAGQGGAFGVFDVAFTVETSTIVGNSATSGLGGAVFGFDGEPILRNCIVRDNGDQPYAGFLGFNLRGDYSNLEGGADAIGEGNIDADPMFVDPAAGDFRLLPGSPSIDTGFNGWVKSFTLDDFDGTPRIQGGTVDMGAFEFPGSVPEPAPVEGSLFVTTKDNFNILFGLDSPIFAYDAESGTWSEFVRNMPSFALAADPEEQCFWLHNGESFMLGRIPYDTRRFEEIGVIKYEGDLSATMNGFAVRDGVLYAVNRFGFGAQPTGLYRIDQRTAVATLLHDLPDEYTLTDLHYDAENDRMLLLSSTESISGDSPLGIFELDVETGALTPVQPWFNDDPFNEVGNLQGLAVGAGRNWIFRSAINELELWDSETLEFEQTIGLPQAYPGSEFGLILSSLTWEPAFSGTPCPEDVSGDGAVGLDDLLAILSAWNQTGGVEDLDGDGLVGLGDLLVVLAAWGPCPE